MEELDNYTFLESSDHVDNGKKFFFITFGSTSFLQQFSEGSKKHITVFIDILDLLIYSTVSFNLFQYCLFKFVFN